MVLFGMMLERRKPKRTFMKKILLSAIGVLAIASACYAQGVKLGVKVGANLTKVSGASFKDEFETGYQLGGWADIGLGGKLGIQPELLWTTSKTKRDTSFRQVYQFKDAELKLDYLTIPVLLRYDLSKLVTLNLGPQFGILLNKEKTVIQNGQEAFKGGDFSMVGGLQLNFSALRVYGRYNVGLTNLNDIDNKDKWRNQQVQLGVGLKL
jgi:hypothetical protein